MSLLSISSLIGDTLILVGSVRFNAIKLHTVPVIFIRYIAVADLLVTLSGVLPAAVSLAANEWILGDVLCYLNFFGRCSCALVICQLFAALALSKMLIVKYPLRAIQFSGKAAHLVAGSMWAYSVIFPAVAIARDKGDVYFSYIVYNCDYDCSWGHVECEKLSTAIVLSVSACTVVTVVSSVVLMVEARRVARRVPGGLNWRGVVTVLLTVAVHTIVTLPLATYYISEYHTDNRSLNLYRPAWFIAILAILNWRGVVTVLLTVAVQIMITLPLPIYYITQNLADCFRLNRAAWFIDVLGVVTNFYIFTLTLPSFREFLKSRILAPLMKCCTAQGDERSGERRRLLD